MEKSYIDSIIDPEIDKLNRNNEHIQNQIEMFEDMIYDYSLDRKENDIKLEKLKEIKNLQ